MTDKLRWGLIGLGGIARQFAKGLVKSETGVLVAAGSRSQESADRFAGDFGLERAYPSYEELLADSAVDAVYIATPHPLHAEWAVKTAEAGKHILCEKPIGLNHAQAMGMIEAAVRHDVFLMEAFMYRCHPQTQKVVDLVKDGAIGEVRAMQGTFGFHAGFNPEGRLFAQELGGGGILDVGCYPVSMARLIAGVATGADFANPVEVTGQGHLIATGVDSWAFATLTFDGGIIAQVGTAVELNLDNTFSIFGSEGKINISNPWTPARDGGNAVFSLHRSGAKAECVTVASTVSLYGAEADTVARSLDGRQGRSPAMSWDDTLGNMETLDRWRAAIGLVYDAEKPDHPVRTLHGRPLTRRTSAPMTYASVPGVELPLSRLVMGCDNQPSTSHATAIFDEYFECGGNTFDTAHIYGGGEQERLLGWWMKHRGIRDQVAVISKGAHSPNCFPAKVSDQLRQSLDRLQTDRADVYFLHRDNLDVPVAEFIDVLNEHVEAGRIGAFGGSNWTAARIAEANAYAEQSGKRGFAAVSNNFSLARMIDPVWPGCIAASDPEYRQYLEQTQLCLMPWSSQARGFFTGRAHPEDLSDDQLVRCWYSDGNFKRLERARQLASERGVLPINVALAFVLCQPFPTHPLIGPRTLAELRTSLPALDVHLTAAEVTWLNLEEDA